MVQLLRWLVLKILPAETLRNIAGPVRTFEFNIEQLRSEQVALLEEFWRHSKDPGFQILLEFIELRKNNLVLNLQHAKDERGAVETRNRLTELTDVTFAVRDALARGKLKTQKKTPEGAIPGTVRSINRSGGNYAGSAL